LRTLGWKVVVIWECQTRELATLRAELTHLLGDQ
jgi:G:T-mismatch repair DNA endonuclease (very short patch repair protein)